MNSRTSPLAPALTGPKASAADAAWIRALHIFPLWAFAVAQPIFQVVAADPNFFVARGARGAEILVLIVLAVAVAPLPFVCASLLSAAAGRGVHRIVHGALVAAFLALMALIPLGRWLSSSVAAPLIGSGLLGLAGAWLYDRFSALRGYATWLIAAVFVFPGLFVAHPGVWKLVRPAPELFHGPGASDTTTPLVLVILDELPVVSLLDRGRQIDPIRYPNFAALAAHATWYPNAIASADYTSTSVPAILTGRYPRQGQLPIVGDHPQNLFTWLAPSHDLQVLETFTELCPRSLCERGSQPLARRIRDQVLDLGIVYLHIVLPRPLTKELPPVMQNWQGVDRAKAGSHPPDNPWSRLARGDRGDQFSGFVARIRRSERPPLIFLHSALPHAPWNRLPSGTRYPTVGEPAWAPLDRWHHDEAAVSEVYLRHLLQLEYVDRLLGRLLERLRALDLYEEAMVVVTADHGMSFSPGGHRRGLSPGNAAEVLSVPLLVKAPLQTESALETRWFEATELIGTIAEGLGVELPWETDAPRAGPRPPASLEEIRSYRTYPGDLLTIPVARLDTEASLRRKLELFGSGDRPLFPTRPTRLARLLGRPIGSFDLAAPSDVRLELPLDAAALTVADDLAEVPARLSGRAERAGGDRAPFLLAVAVNGVLRAVTRVDVRRQGRSDAFWSALVEEESFVAGANRVEFYLLELPASGPRLRPARAVFGAPS